MSYLFHQLEYQLTDLEDIGYSCKITKLVAAQNAVELINANSESIFLPEEQLFYFNAHIKSSKSEFTGEEMQRYELTMHYNEVFPHHGYNVTISQEIVTDDVSLDDRLQKIGARISHSINVINRSRQAIGTIYFTYPLINGAKRYKLTVMVAIIVIDPNPITAW